MKRASSWCLFRSLPTKHVIVAVLSSEIECSWWWLLLAGKSVPAHKYIYIYIHLYHSSKCSLQHTYLSWSSICSEMRLGYLSPTGAACKKMSWPHFAWLVDVRLTHSKTWHESFGLVNQPDTQTWRHNWNRKPHFSRKTINLLVSVYRVELSLGIGIHDPFHGGCGWQWMSST